MSDKDPAERLAEETGEPVEKFTADKYDIPEFGDLKTTHFKVPDDFDGDIVGAVPIAELEELVYEWRTNDYPISHEKRDKYPYRTGVGRGYNRASIDLAKLIEEHKDD